uniref:Uncharacterized protein n=1 Tax=Trichogramma kaykai TaxID=54128 RepID=A0ABD2WC86_9HYME
MIEAQDGQSGCYYDEVRSAARRGAATEARRTMGKKGAKRKTRWRTLSIGSEYCSSNTTSSNPPSYRCLFVCMWV